VSPQFESSTLVATGEVGPGPVNLAGHAPGETDGDATVDRFGEVEPEQPRRRARSRRGAPTSCARSLVGQTGISQSGTTPYRAVKDILADRDIASQAMTVELPSLRCTTTSRRSGV
jgi:hypothetical protein